MVFCRFSTRPPRPAARHGQIRPLPPPPVVRLLERLRGRTVGVLVQGQEREGRVIMIDPVSVTLAGAGGSVAVIPLTRIASVRF